MLDKHDFSQWYDIVHFEYKCDFVLVFSKGLMPIELIFLTYETHDHF